MEALAPLTEVPTAPTRAQSASAAAHSDRTSERPRKGLPRATVLTCTCIVITHTTIVATNARVVRQIKMFQKFKKISFCTYTMIIFSLVFFLFIHIRCRYTQPFRCTHRYNERFLLYIHNIIIHASYKYVWNFICSFLRVTSTLLFFFLYIIVVNNYY